MCCIWIADSILWSKKKSKLNLSLEKISYINIIKCLIINKKELTIKHISLWKLSHFQANIVECTCKKMATYGQKIYIFCEAFFITNWRASCFYKANAYILLKLIQANSPEWNREVILCALLRFWQTILIWEYVWWYSILYTRRSITVRSFTFQTNSANITLYEWIILKS